MDEKRKIAKYVIDQETDLPLTFIGIAFSLLEFLCYDSKFRFCSIKIIF